MSLPPSLPSAGLLAGRGATRSLDGCLSPPPWHLLFEAWALLGVRVTLSPGAHGVEGWLPDSCHRMSKLCLSLSLLASGGLTMPSLRP